MNQNKASKDDCWKEEYEFYIAHGEVDKAKEILLNIIPKDKMIYKYFRGINRDYDTFTKPELWLCNAYYLNDPFDCAFLINKCKEGIKTNIDYCNQMKQNVESANLQRTVAISCFSERSDSILMWGHYANNHRGICVGYSLRELIETFECFPVIYTGKMMQYRKKDSVWKNVLTKYIEWSYEHEWRIIQIDESLRGKEGKAIAFVKPREIILGCKNNDFLWHLSVAVDVKKQEIDANKLIEYAQNKLGTQCYQYELDPGEFSLRKIVRM